MSKNQTFDANQINIYNYTKLEILLLVCMEKWNIEAHKGKELLHTLDLIQNIDDSIYFSKRYFWGSEDSCVVIDGNAQYAMKYTDICERILKKMRTVKKMEDGKCDFSWVEYTHKFKGGSDYRTIAAKMGNLHLVAMWLMDEGIYNVLGQDQTVYCNGEVVPASVVKQLLHYHIDRFPSETED